MNRDTRTAYRARARNTERTIDDAVAAVNAEKQASWDAAKVAALERAADRVHFTRDDIVNARAIRTSTGWRIVAKVNAKTVSVETGYSWVDRIPFDRIIQVAT